MRRVRKMKINRIKSRTASFNTVFFCPPIGKSLPDCSPARLEGGLFFSRSNPKHGGKDMRTKGTEQCSELMEVEVQAALARQKEANEISPKFRAKIASDLQMAFRMFAGVTR